MTLSRGAICAAAFSLAAFAVSAQAATVVAPGEYATADAAAAQFAILGNPANSASTFQFVVSASELSGIAPGALITALGYRFAGSPYTEPVGPASFSRYDIQIGSAANSTSALSTAYASNMGADTILARSGAMTIPAGSFVDLAGNGPNAFYDLIFTTPYTYTGGDLAITTRYVPTSGNPGIALDAFAPDSRVNIVFTFGSATATTGVIASGSAPVTRFTFTAAAPAVPEPSTWAMMLVGFGAIGLAMRRNQRQTVRVNFA